jgi:hypothetical protein
MNFYAKYFQANYFKVSCHFCCTILFCCFTLSSNAAMSDAEANHLLRRAGFAVFCSDLPAWSALSR